MTDGSGINILHGKVMLDGNPAAGQLVIMLSADMNEFYNSTSTEMDGSYEIEIPLSCTGTTVVLVSKIQSPIVALDYLTGSIETADKQYDFNFDTAGGAFNTLYGEVLTDNFEFPPFVKINITPVHLDGIPQALEKFFLRREKAVVDGSYFEKKAEGKQFSIKLQKGTYRFSASYLIYKAANSTLDIPPNYITVSMLLNDKAIPNPKETLGAFIINITEDSFAKIFMKAISGPEIFSQDQ